MTMPPRLAAIAGTQCGVFTTGQALSAGYNADEIARLRRSGAWVRLRRGVYIERALLPDDERGIHLLLLRAALLTLHGPVAASHLTSAVLQGITMLDPDLSLVHITRTDAGSARTIAGIRQHNASLPASHLTKFDEMLATGAARTVVDLARSAPFDAALVAAESALYQELTTLSELREVLAYCAEWPGARRAGRVVAFASPYSETPGETIGRVAFDELGVPSPEQQVLIFDERGFVGRADFYWAEQHTVGEFDGKLKYAGNDIRDDVLLREKEREDRLREAGLEVFRIDWRESRARSTSVRRKAFSAFDRAARSTAKCTYRIKRQPPPE